MRTTLFYVAPPERIRPGDELLIDDGWLEVDAITIRSDVVEVAGWPEGRHSRHRTVLRFEPDRLVRVQPSRAAVATALGELLDERSNKAEVLVPIGEYMLSLRWDREDESPIELFAEAEAELARPALTVEGRDVVNPQIEQSA